MKQAKFIIPFAAAILLAGCSVGGETVSSSNKVSSEPSTIVPVESSEASSEKDTSISSDAESSEESEPSPITIDDLKNYCTTFSSNVSKISGGTIAHNSKDAYSDDTTTTNFVYGNDVNGDTLKVTSGYDTIFVMKDGNGQVVTALEDGNGSYQKADGYYYDSYEAVGPRFYTALDSSYIYGAEGFLKNLVSKAESNVNKDLIAFADGGKVTFGFGYYNEEEPSTVYNVVADFSSTNDALTSFNFKIYQYSNTSDDPKFTFDSATKTFTVLENVEASGLDTFTIVQTAGTRTYENDVDLESFKFKSIALKNVNGEALGTETPLEVSRGSEFAVYIDATPATANTSFDRLGWSITSGDEYGVWGYIEYDDFKEQYCLHLTADLTGDYVIEVKNSDGSASASFALTVTGVVVEGMSVRLYTEEPDSEYSSVKLVDGQTITTTTESDNIIYFVPNVKTGAGAGAFSATLTDMDGEEIDDEALYFDDEDSFDASDDEWIDAVGFCYEVTGQYKLTIQSEDDPEIKQTFTINVVDNDPVNVLSKTYVLENSDGTKSTLTFKDYEGDPYAGTAVLTGEDDSSTEAGFSIVPQEDENYSYFVYNEGDESLIPFYFALGGDGALYSSDEEGGWYDKLYSSDSLEYSLCKKWTGVDSDNGDHTMTLEFSPDGTVSGKIEGRGSTYDLSCEYTVSEYSAGYYDIKFMDDGYAWCENTWFGDESENEYSFNRTGDWEKDGGSISLTASYLDLSFNLYPSED